jgi:hypothetical protein
MKKESEGFLLYVMQMVMATLTGIHKAMILLSANDTYYKYYYFLIFTAKI